uniref:3-deoxy-manno-octulosonate-8-phosphatase KdsC n=1 Tax=Ningiella ruwaisensis TaxID=2364274 RepID=UPI0010A06EF9|nr:3-deoxy-manno-octulosonate-8-phosphatase KdsC [Ningiella ruwaisensis]
MATVNTLYGPIDEDILGACASLKLLVLDVDGVLSDGAIYMGNNGEELKAFNVKDGYGIKAVAKCGVDIAVITGRRSKIVEDRMSALNAKFIVQGEEDKYHALIDIMKSLNISSEQVASIGDDMPDMGLYKLSHLKVAVADAHPFIKQHANVQLTLNGGQGAVREFCDLILQAKGLLDMTHGASL